MVNAAKVRWRGNLLFLLVAALVLTADQVTKALIRANLVLGQSIPPEGRFRLSYSTNAGGVFGLPLNSSFLLILAAIVVVSIIWLYFRYLSAKGKLLQASLGLVLGGAGGNLLDRIRFGAVTDFIDVRLWGHYHWLNFNIADASLNIGAIILAGLLLSAARKQG